MWGFILLVIVILVILGIFFGGDVVHKKKDGKTDWEEELEEWDWTENPDDPYGKY